MACERRRRARRCTSAIDPTGCAPRCSAPTTGSCRPPASCSASPPRARPARRSSRPGSPGSSAGALSMAAGEYVSVSSQRDAEQADLRLEAARAAPDPTGELRELAGIYERRGLSPALAGEVAADALASRCAGGARPRRARPRRAATGPPVPGRVDVGALFRGGRDAPLVAVAAPPAGARSAPRGRDPGRPRTARRDRRPARGGAARPARSASSPGARRDGDHRRGRRARGERCLTGVARHAVSCRSSTMRTGLSAAPYVSTSCYHGSVPRPCTGAGHRALTRPRARGRVRSARAQPSKSGGACAGCAHDATRPCGSRGTAAC